MEEVRFGKTSLALSSQAASRDERFDSIFMNEKVIPDLCPGFVLIYRAEIPFSALSEEQLSLMRDLFRKLKENGIEVKFTSMYLRSLFLILLFHFNNYLN